MLVLINNARTNIGGTLDNGVMLSIKGTECLNSVDTMASSHIDNLSLTLLSRKVHSKTLFQQLYTLD